MANCDSRLLLVAFENCSGNANMYFSSNGWEWIAFGPVRQDVLA
jgi:hypothetical protein